MNIHKNARLTLVRRLEMVRDIVESGLGVTRQGQRSDKGQQDELVTRDIQQRELVAVDLSGWAGNTVFDLASRQTIPP